MNEVISVENFQLLRELKHTKNFFDQHNLIDLRLEIENINKQFIKDYFLPKLEEQNIANRKKICDKYKKILTATLNAKLIENYEKGKDFYLTLDEGQYIRDFKQNCDCEQRGITFLTSLLIECEIDFDLILSEIAEEVREYHLQNFAPLFSQKSAEEDGKIVYHVIKCYYNDAIKELIPKGIYHGIKTCYCSV